jgi:hypothetical protein
MSETAAGLPVTWRDPGRDDRPCDQCPATGTRVFWSGREWCLCEDCYQRFVVGR